MENERMNTRLSRIGTTAAAIAMATALFGLTACTADDAAPSEEQTPSATPTAVEGAPDPDTPAFGGVQGEVIASEDIANDPLLFADVALTGCAASDAGYAATGTATNARAEAQDYRIVVNFTDAQARAITSVVVDVTAEAGAAAEWTADAEITAPEGTNCVIVGVGPVA
jgi:hypothetical protein